MQMDLAKKLSLGRSKYRSKVEFTYPRKEDSLVVVSVENQLTENNISGLII